MTEPAPSGARPARAVAALPALLLTAVALWEIGATRHAATSVPGDDDWTRAAAIVRGRYLPGDLIVFAPSWNDPVGRLHLGDLIPIEAAARMDADRYSRVWEVSIRDARSPELAGRPAVHERAGGIDVRLFERAAASVLADVRDRVATATVRDGGSGPTLELAEIGFAPRRCLQAVPAENRPMRITFPSLPLGSSLVGYVGIADVFTRRNQRAPARLDVELGGAVVASVTAGVDDGWVRFAATTTPGVADVTFVVRSSAKNRLICFAAEARR